MNSEDYISELAKFPPLSVEEEESLFTQYLASRDERIKQKIINHNLRLVMVIAKKFKVKHASFLDLFQEGSMGLIRAVEKYDLNQGVRFSTYAGYWIRARLYRCYTSNLHLVKMGTTEEQRKLIFNYSKLKAKLESQGLEPTVELIAKTLQVKKDTVRDMEVRFASPLVRTDTVGNNWDDESGKNARTGVELVSNDKLQDQELESKEEYQFLMGLLEEFYETLPNEKQRFIFKNRLMISEPRPFKELGDECGVSRQRAQQLFSRMQIRLQEFMNKNAVYRSRLYS